MQSEFTIKPAEENIDRTDGGFNFPVYDVVEYVDMKSSTSSNNALRAAGDQRLPIADGAAAPDTSVPAMVGAQ